jgi:LacI family transcriptional regulator, galactose operon repressor
VKKLSTKDIAQALNLSRLTVSSVLNGKSKERRISDDTCKIVEEYLREKGYVTPKYALQVRGDIKKEIGIFCCNNMVYHPHITNAYFSITNRIMKRFGPCETVLTEPEDKLKGLRELLARGVTELIWIHTRPAENEFSGLEGNEALLRRFDRVFVYNFFMEYAKDLDSFNNLKICMIGVNRTIAHEKLAKKIHDMGHEKLAIGDEDYGLLPYKNNKTFKAFTDNKIQLYGIGSLWHSSDLFNSEFSNMCKRVSSNLIRLINEHGVSVAYIYNDNIAGVIISELTSQGIRIPEDISIIGFGGLPIGETFKVSLTSLKMPMEKMINQLETLLTQKTIKSKQFCFDLEMIERDSLEPKCVIKKGSLK